MTDDLRALLADLNTWPMYLSRDVDGNDLTTISKGQVAGALRAILAAYPEPATPTTGPTWDQVLAILSAHYDALSQQPEHRHFRAGVWSAYERIQAAKRAHTPVPPETPSEDQP